MKSVLSNFKNNLNEAQHRILQNTCFSHFLECKEIFVQSQQIHYFLLRQVQQPSEGELWFNIAGKFVRLLISEFYLVTVLRYVGDADTNRMKKTPTRLENVYFPTLKNVTHENGKDAFLRSIDILDKDVSMLATLYFITSYLYPRDFKKAEDHFLFVLVENFNAMNVFPWGKSLFDTLVSSMREGLSKRATHYRLRGLLITFQVWIYKTILSLDGYTARRISKVYLRIMNWVADDHPSAAKLEGLE
ncbi:uncharacterized protein LOC111368996 [Olea europaea var. sylvestris]|uniref:uncharacterized protein LOC111368996 n=1 Tax=Olea europaea var. sylvestris TaxID=158386 RepID=UPI000C1D6B30|nr:uncharacterized protein LOC111368996 [Olea europaea var. sylvestris]